MAEARFTDVGKRFGDQEALAGFSLTVGDGELVTVLGPSGCGKSTLLRLTAGLEDLSSGTITLGGRRVDRLSPQNRDVAMVFQSYALYPHLSVAENVAFPLRMRGVAAAERARRVREVAELLEIEGLLARRPRALSGGQRQRVALARALVRKPALFLLAEPLSNLDARLRTSVRRHLKALQRRLGVTTLYVTHDQTEALTLGDRVVVLERGRVQQVATPEALYARPANTFVAGFVGTPPMNLLPATLANGALVVGGQRLAVPAALRQRLAAAGPRLIAGMRPEAFAPLADTAGDAEDVVRAEVLPDEAEHLGAETVVAARVGETAVSVRLAIAAGALPSRVGAPAAALHFFTEDGNRIEH